MNEPCTALEYGTVVFGHQSLGPTHNSSVADLSAWKGKGMEARWKHVVPDFPGLLAVSPFAAIDSGEWKGRKGAG